MLLNGCDREPEQRDEPEPHTALQELADILDERLLAQARGGLAGSTWL